MVYGIFKQHDGLIHVYSEAGNGSVFKIYLPASSAPAEDVKHADESALVGGNETVLVIEDEAVLRKIISMALESEGYQVYAASNEEEGMRIYDENIKRIDLVLSDAVMPRMGGREIYEIVHRREPTLKFLFMSGYSVNSLDEKFIISRQLAFLQKPFGTIDLLRKIREVVDKPNVSF